MKKKDYWYSLDMIKGVLIILVFLGHIIPGSIQDTFPRYVIYSFHMPLFIGISGFLLNIEKVDIRFSTLFMKYWKRVGLPWCIAVIVFLIVDSIVFRGSILITGMDIVKAFLYPSYHLWYIMGFVFYVLISCFLWKSIRNIRHKWIYIFLIVSAISIISRWNLLNGKISNEYINVVLEGIRHNLRLYHYIYFVLGMYCRYKYEHNKVILSDKWIGIVRGMMYLLVGAMLIQFFCKYPNINKFLFYAMNACILLVIFQDCVKEKLPRNVILEFLGEYSLPIYLYHVLSKRLGQFLFDGETVGYYIVCISTFIVGCVLVYYLRRVSFIDKKIFGSTKGN